jgi:undecaprenyl-diphosphatase
LNDLNHALFLALNGGPDSSKAAVAIAIFAAKYLILLVPLHLVLVWIGGDRKMRFIAVTGVTALLLALAINQGIGLVAYSPRPFIIGLGHQLIEHRDSSSMPSNHATIFFAYAATLLIFRATGLGVTAALLGLCVAWSRIYLGIHYPADMLGAAISSTAAAFAAVWLMARYGTRVLATIERVYTRTLAGVTAALNGDR